MASRRKRKAPHRFDFTPKVPRLSSMPGAEAVRNVSTPLSDPDQDHHFWDVPQLNYNPSLGRRRKRKRGKEGALLGDDLLPHSELALTILASKSSLPASCEFSSLACTVPILHLQNHTSIVEKILQHRLQCTSMDAQSSCVPSEDNDRYVYVGDVMMGLDGPLDMATVFKKGKLSVRLSLVLYRGVAREGKDNGGQWLLKLEGRKAVDYVHLKMDHRFAGVPCQLLGEMWQKTSFMKLFLAHSAENSVLQESLQLEVWALGMMYHSGSAFELGEKLAAQPFYTLLVKTLYPTEVMMDPTEVVMDATDEACCSPCADKGQTSAAGQVQKFYKDVRQRQQLEQGQWRAEGEDSASSPLNPPVIIPGLLATLRGYQSKALAWMLQKEGVADAGEGGADEGKCELHVLWRKLPVNCKMAVQQVYFNPFTARFSTTFFLAPPLPKGGILADEMGLGKTVEVLALILAHKWNGMDPCRISGSHVTYNEEAVGGRGLIAEDEADNPSSTRGGREDGEEQESMKMVGDEEEGKEIKEASTQEEGEELCLCGATESLPGEGWVECERCLIWQHISCSAHSKKESNIFICIKCLLKEPLPCGATLVICPRAICEQWKEEIEAHTFDGVLRVILYQGVAKEYVSPLLLAACDVVLVSYEILRSELYHVTSHQDFYKKLRHPKRFQYFPSPLPALHWWRIVLDEAQMVENTTVRAAEMVRKLSTVNRWCVTGTPIQKDLRDLYGLLLFLGVEPYHMHEWYQRLLWTPLTRGRELPMVSVFSHLMWRNSKADVSQEEAASRKTTKYAGLLSDIKKTGYRAGLITVELQLPVQTEHVHLVCFRSVEEYFYRRQQETCMTRASTFTWPADDTALSSMSYRAMLTFLTPLHSLRQACCTPSMVKSGYLLQDLTKKTVTMEYLLVKLIQQAKMDARESLRQLVSTLNGLAGLLTLQKKPYEAMCRYREAMDLWQEYKHHQVECDKLQRIHTLENLTVLLPDGVWPRKSDGVESASDSKSSECGTLGCPEDWEESEAALQAESGEDEVKEMGEVCEGHAMETGLSDGEEQAAVQGDGERRLVSVAVALEEPTGMDVEEVGVAPGTREVKESTPATKIQEGALSNPAEREGSRDPNYYLRDYILMEEALRLREEYSKREEENVKAAMELLQARKNVVVQAKQKAQQSLGDMLQCQGERKEKEEEGENRSTRREPQPSLEEKVKEEDVKGEADMGEVEEKGKSEEVPVERASSTSCSDHQKKPTSLWVALVMWLKKWGRDDALQAIMRLHLCQYKSLNHVASDIGLNIDKMESACEEVWHSLNDLCDPSRSAELLEEAIACHLDPAVALSYKRKCGLCLSQSVMMAYEESLFSHYEEGANTEVVTGSRVPSKVEQLLKTLLMLSRRKRAPKSLVQAGQLFMAYLESLRKEYPVMRQLWLKLEYRLGTLYELTQASTKLHFYTDYDVNHDISYPQGLFPFEVQFRLAQWMHDRDGYLVELKKHVGQMIYLKNLEKLHNQPKYKEPCPICTTVMDLELGMFPCGHAVCLECADTITKRRYLHNGRIRLSCPLCRKACFSSDIHYVVLGHKHEEGLVDEEEEVVNANHASKILAVVRTLLQIQRKEPRAKALVFSSWVEVLGHISDCLEENHVPHHLLKQTHFQSQLTSFKTTPYINVLLLPLQTGAKGLNIVEATHVLLVEPQLNISTELQAIGRIHRIGQTKPTKVHRFIVRGTVEEHIYKWTRRGEAETGGGASPHGDILVGCESEMTCGDVKRLLAGEEARTDLMGEEEARTDLVGEEARTDLVGEEEARTDLVGEEEARTDLVGEEEARTDLVGEEEARTGLMGEEEARTDLVGEEARTDLVGEEEARTDLVGEEEARTDLVGEEEARTDLVGEEEARTGLMGEEARTDLVGEEEARTDLVGEEEARTGLVGEEEARTDLVGEEEARTDLVGEEEARTDLMGEEAARTDLVGEEEARTDPLKAGIPAGT